MYCTNCGRQLPNSVKVCGNCGYRVGPATSNQRAAPPPGAAPSPVIVIHDRGGSGGLWLFLTIVLILGLLWRYGVIEIPDGMQEQVSLLQQNLVSFIQANQTNGGSDSGGANAQPSSGTSAGQANQNIGANGQPADEGEPAQDQPEEQEQPIYRDGIIEVQPEQEEPPSRDGVIEVQPEQQPFSFTFVNMSENEDLCVYKVVIRPVGSDDDFPSIPVVPIQPNGGSATINVPYQAEEYVIDVSVDSCTIPGFQDLTYQKYVNLGPGVIYPFRPQN